MIDRQQKELRGLGQHEGAISVLESLGSIDSVDAFEIINQRRLLLVEGSADRKTLRALAAKRGSRVFEGEGRLVVIETGGESTPHAQTDLAILEKIVDDEVSSLQILDRDARLDDFLNTAEADSPRPLHIWRRDSIESYLLVPAAIGRLVAARRSDTDEGTVQAFVEERITTGIETLRDETFDRIGTRYRRDIINTQGRNVEPKEANEVARKVMEDEDSVLRLTHGKSLLSLVRKDVQDEFAVSFGNQALIAEMTEDEFDPEISHILDQIGALTI